MNSNDLTFTILAQDTQPPAPSPAGGETPGSQGGMGGLGGMLPMMILMFVVFYFVLIRPQRKRQKEAQLMLDNMRIGDAVVSAGGIHGIVTNKTDTTVTVRVAQGVKIRFDKASITKVTPKDRGGDEPEPDEAAEDEAGEGEDSKS